MQYTHCMRCQPMDTFHICVCRSGWPECMPCIIQHRGVVRRCWSLDSVRPPHTYEYIYHIVQNAAVYSYCSPAVCARHSVPFLCFKACPAVVSG